LKRYRFPGNVRELENILERAVALAGDDLLMADDLMLPGPEVDLPIEAEPIPADEVQAGEADLSDAVAAEVADFSVVEGVPTSLSAYLDSLERDAIRRALERTRYNRTAAAQLLGITFRQLRYRMQRLGIK